MRRIIIADDSKFMRKIVRKVVESLGASEIYEAADGREVIELAKKIKPELIIMDINMPNMDGLTALKNIVELGLNPKVVVLTAINQRWALNAAKNLGVVAYLSKPFKLQRLVEVIKDIAEK